MPHPDKDSEPSEKSRRRPSHFRKKRQDGTTQPVRVPRNDGGQENDPSRFVQSAGVHQEQWSEVINRAPALPDPLLHRPMPPPAPLPSETASGRPMAAGWLEDRHRRKRVEDIVGTVGLAIMVGAMLAAMWLRMTGP